MLVASCGGVAADFTGLWLPLSPDPVVKILVDSNRNGTLDWGDPSEEDDKTTWNAERGAIMLANIDDHSLRRRHPI